jgi:ABC-type multidrug transport system fused ATPase/permease subunit
MQEANELLQNIRTINLMTWEIQFKDRVLEKRGVEMQRMRTSFIWWSVSMTVFHSLPFVVTILTISIYTVMFGNNLGTTVALPALVIFLVIRIPLDRLSDSIIFLVQAHVSLVRIEKFLMEQETRKCDQLFWKGPGTVGFKNATLTWPTGRDYSVSDQADQETSPSPQFALKYLNIKFPKDALSIVCGVSGSGKLSLLLALLGEMNLVGGEILMSSDEIGRESFSSLELESNPPQSVAYCPQEAWIMN